MGTKKSEKKIKEFDIPVLSGSYFDLTKFDFSSKNITIYDIQSDDFAKYIEALQPDIKEHNLSFVQQIIENMHHGDDKKFAIVKNNPKNDYNFQDLLNVWRFLLILFPSGLQIEYIIHYYDEDGFIQSTSMSYWKLNRHEEFLLASDEDVNEINEFINRYFDRLDQENFLGMAIENYITSFETSHLHYQYLTLCIALESLISGSQELSYRLRRTVAILCGNKKWNCEIIFNNLKTLYELRSKIVHGERYSHKKVKDYIFPLQSIVSRTIIELIIHNISNSENLNEIITGIGFGDRGKISTNWKNYKLNISTIVDSNWKRLS